MKNILVPTDFSACANNALDVGVGMAKTFNAQLHVLTKMDLPKDWDQIKSHEKVQFAEPLQQVENTSILLKHIKDKHSEVDIKTSIVQGKLSNAIKQYVLEHGIDFVVMGSHGSNGKSEFFIGSNTQKIVRTIHCPILVVKDKMESLNFDKVIFASAFDERDKAAFLHFKEWIKPFLPEIHLVNIHTSSMFDPPYFLTKETMDDFKKLCNPFTCFTHIHRNFTIERGIRSFAEEIGAQLIVVSNHYRNPFKRMVRGSTVEALVNHAGIPVLSIDYVEEPVLLTQSQIS